MPLSSVTRTTYKKGIVINSHHGFLPQRLNPLADRLGNVDRRIRSRINTFETWLQDEDRRDFRAMEDIPPEELNRYLTEFLLTVKTLTGEDFSASSLKSIKSCLVSYLRQQGYPHSFSTSPLFAESRAAWKTRLAELRLPRVPQPVEMVEAEEPTVVYENAEEQVEENKEDNTSTTWISQ